MSDKSVGGTLVEQGLARAVQRIFANVKVRPGVTLASINAEVERSAFRALGHRLRWPTFENGFPYASCVSLTSTPCHGVPDGRRVPSEALVKLDVVMRVGGAYVDTCWTYLVGHEYRTLWLKARAVFTEVLDFIGRGHHEWERISSFAVRRARSMGLCISEEFGGHYMGPGLHEEPVLAFGRAAVRHTLKRGRLFTLEPIFYPARMRGYALGSYRGIEPITVSVPFVMFEHTLLLDAEGRLRVLTANLQETSCPVVGKYSGRTS